MFFISLGKHPTTCRGQDPPPHSRGEGTTIFPSTPAVWGAVMGSVSKRTFFDLFCQWNSFSPKKPPFFSSQPTCRKFDMSGFPIPPACLFLGIWKKNAVCFFEFEKKTREKPFYCQKNTCFPIPGGVGVPYACEMVQSWRVFLWFFFKKKRKKRGFFVLNKKKTGGKVPFWVALPLGIFANPTISICKILHLFLQSACVVAKPSGCFCKGSRVVAKPSR